MQEMIRIPTVAPIWLDHLVCYFFLFCCDSACVDGLRLTFDFETDLGSFSWVVQPTRIPEIGILHCRGGKWLVKTDSLFPQPDSCFPSLILASPA